MDFSNVGAPKRPVTPSKPPRKGRVRGGGRGAGGGGAGRKTMAVRVLAAVLVVVASALAYSQTAGKHKAKVAAPAKANFCELGNQLTSLLASAGVPATGPIPASLGAEAFKNVLSQMGGQFTALHDSAPSAVRGKVQTVITAVQQTSAGNAGGIQSPAFVKAERSLAAFLRTGPCGDATGVPTES